MELKLTKGDYSPSPLGGLVTVSGAQELAQRVLMRLTARRGGFAPLPDYGSRLHLLTREKASERALAARQYIAEALADEAGLKLDEVILSEPDFSGQMDLTADFTFSGEHFRVTAQIGGTI